MTGATQVPLQLAGIGHKVVRRQLDLVWPQGVGRRRLAFDRQCHAMDQRRLGRDATRAEVNQTPRILARQQVQFLLAVEGGHHLLLRRRHVAAEEHRCRRDQRDHLGRVLVDVKPLPDAPQSEVVALGEP